MSNTMKTGVLQAGHAPPELTPGFGDYDQFFERLLAAVGAQIIAFFKRKRE